MNPILKKALLIVFAVVAIPLLSMLIYLFFIFAATGFNPHFLEIDFCLDNGGWWNYIENICETSNNNNVSVQRSFPEELNDLKGADPERYIEKVNEIPQKVLNELQRTIPSGRLEMADRGNKWNKTDVVRDSTLPFNRLVWAVEIQGRYVVHYETGGIGYSTHFIVIALDKTDKNWKVIWGATGFNIAPDYPSFISELEKGNLIVGVTLYH